MPIVKVSEATNIQLNWVVAKCEDKLGECTQAKNFAELCKERKGVAFTHGRVYSPSTNWSQGGPIIEREKITVAVSESGDEWNAARVFSRQRDDCYWSGPTPLIAAMRCYVGSKLGEEVEVPDELV